MKNAGIAIGIVSLVAVAVVGFFLHVSLRSYTDRQVADARDNQDSVRAAQAGLRDSLEDIEKRLGELEMKIKVGPESYDMEIASLDAAVKNLKKRLDDLEKGGLASASEGTSTNKRKVSGDIGDFGDLLGGDEGLTDEEKAAREEERTKRFRGILRGFAKEGMKMMKKTTEDRLAKAVEKLSLAAGQESQMKTAIDNAMEKARDLIDRAIAGEDVSEEFRKLREETDADAKEILTEDQYKEWKKSDPMRGGGMGRGMWGGGRRRSSGGDGGGQSE